MPELTYSLDGENRIALFVIDTAGSVNTIGQRFISDLERAAARALKDRVSGVIFVSGKQRSFLDGANLQEFLTDATLPAIRSVVVRFQDALRALALAPFPVVAILDGQTALGGGFELLLWACDQVFSTASSRMGLPEVNVGLFPAGGGTRTLRRVVGFKTAVEMITGARVSPAEAFASPHFLTVCEADELRPRAVRWLLDHPDHVNRNHDPNFEEPFPISEADAQVVLNKARFRYTVCPQRPYFEAVLDVLELGLTATFEESLKAEVDRFTPLFEHPNSKCKISFFFLATSKAPKLVKVDRRRAAPVDSIAVVGGGLMGRGIAQAAAEKGLKVSILDVDERAARAAVKKIDDTLSALAARGKWSQGRKDAVMANIRPVSDYGAIADTPLIIESVFEDMSLKRTIVEKVQELNPEAVLASNTSTLPIGEISEGATRPDRVVGMHFFSPVPLMPLLEVIESRETSREVVATAVTVGRLLGKTVILVGDGPGFYTSRTFGAYVMNGFRLVELGLSPWDVDLLALQAGFPQGPLHVYGSTGGTVIYHANKFLESRFPERMAVPKSLTGVFEAGYTGAGKKCFYLDQRNFIRDETILPHLFRREGLPTPSDEEAKEILLLGMVNEAFWSLSDGVVRDYYSMDLGAVLGIGFPDCLHGPAGYVSLLGVSKVKTRLQELAERFDMPSLAPAPEFTMLEACGLNSGLI
jgi:3-hydroxyacyl-CoA dehydrogenase/enoyl-CoA hydratase/3-hydroxybutyryl-CoA epimerase